MHSPLHPECNSPQTCVRETTSNRSLCRLLLQKSRSKGLVFPSIREAKLTGANPIGGGKQQVAGRAWPMRFC
ncbi:hypothetical protein pipiens_014492 [Culex pipiens pipiens]|uniref:Uncharacterized protein n=1 Tax=Culex pipiens pipiens TaxID=38569 RepID=A0ABD1CUE8_CULPP